MKRYFTARLASAFLFAGLAIGNAQATVLHCQGGGVDIYWRVEPTPTAAYWLNGGWTANVCEPPGGNTWHCTVYGDFYQIDSPSTDLRIPHFQQWVIYRATGKFHLHSWYDFEKAQEDFDGVCVVSPEPTAAPPKF